VFRTVFSDLHVRRWHALGAFPVAIPVLSRFEMLGQTTPMTAGELPALPVSGSERPVQVAIAALSI